MFTVLEYKCQRYKKRVSEIGINLCFHFTNGGECVYSTVVFG